MSTAQLDDAVWRTDAPSGVTVLTETVPTVRSVAVGIWVRTASAHEHRAKMGVSHLLEHMVFKGTERRSAREIALALETRGGVLDAFTGRDQTSFQARVLDEDLSRAVDILTDLVRQPLLRPGDLELERNVVLEEIAMIEDTPDELVFDLHARCLWPEHPYGYRIVGTRETVSALSADDLRELHRRAYRPGNCVIAAAGRLQHDDLLALLEPSGWLSERVDAERPAAAPAAPPAVRSADEWFERPLQQTHVIVGTDAVPYADRRRLAISLLGTVLGGGMSSRLFQRVREELGLAYAVFAFQGFYVASGLAGVYVATQPRTAREAVQAIRAELARIAADGLSPAELADGKQQLKGQVTLGSESPPARMHRLATSALYEDAYRSLDDTLAEVEALTIDDVAGAAGEFFDPARQTTVWLGPAEGSAGP